MAEEPLSDEQSDLFGSSPEFPDSPEPDPARPADRDSQERDQDQESQDSVRDKDSQDDDKDKDFAVDPGWTTTDPKGRVTHYDFDLGNPHAEYRPTPPWYSLDWSVVTPADSQPTAAELEELVKVVRAKSRYPESVRALAFWSSDGGQGHGSKAPGGIKGIAGYCQFASVPAYAAFLNCFGKNQTGAEPSCAPRRTSPSPRSPPPPLPLARTQRRRGIAAEATCAPRHAAAVLRPEAQVASPRPHPPRGTGRLPAAAPAPQSTGPRGARSVR